HVPHAPHTSPTLSLTLGCRQPRRHGGALAYLAFDGERAAVGFDDAAADGEAEAGASRGAVAGGIDAVEALRQVGEVLGRDPFTRVLHARDDLPARGLRGEADAAAFRGVPHGVVHQVEEEAGEVIAVAAGSEGWLGGLDDDLDRLAVPHELRR